MRATGESWAPRLLTVGWVGVGVAPVVSAVALLRTAWAPVIDNALIAAMTVDSLTADPPLVGMPTSLGSEGGVPLSHAGPLGFWLLALPTKVLGEPGNGLIVGSTLLTLACLAGVATLLRRHGDLVLEAIGLLLVAAMAASLGGGVLTSPFNPHLGVLPLLLCAVAVWGVLAGHHRQLYVVVLAGSVAAQTHLGNVLLVGSLVALTAAGLAFDLVRSSGATRRRLVRRIIPIGILLGALAWIGPIIDQLFGTGNLLRLLRSQSGERPTTGLRHGLDLAAQMTSLPPRWLLDRARDQDLSDPSAARVALSVGAVVLAAALLVWSIRRRDRMVAALAVTSAVTLVVATATSSRVVDATTSRFFVVEDAVLYRLFWWPVGLLFALTVLFGTFRVGSELVRGRAPDLDLRRLCVPALAAAIAVSLFVTAVAHVSPDEGLEAFYSHELASARAIAALPGSPESVVLLIEPLAPASTTAERLPDVWDLGPDGQYGFTMNLVAQLRLRGIAVRFADESNDGITFMLAYRNEHRAAGDEPVVLLHRVGADVHTAPPPGYRRIAVTGAGPGEPFDPLTAPSAVYVRS